MVYFTGKNKDDGISRRRCPLQKIDYMYYWCNLLMHATTVVH